MNVATFPRAERRRHYDPTPRVIYAPVQNNCRLVRSGSPAYSALLAMDFEPIQHEGESVLMRAPHGFEVIQ
jgi:hypothetical protein